MTTGCRLERTEVTLRTLKKRLTKLLEDLCITEYDCGTVDSIRVSDIIDVSGAVIERLPDRLAGRVAGGDILNGSGGLLVPYNEVITKTTAEEFKGYQYDRSVRVRSVFTCESEHGVCARCWGADPDTGRLACVGDPVGAHAALAVADGLRAIAAGKLHMAFPRFHIGQAGQSRFTSRAESNGVVRFVNVPAVNLPGRGLVVAKNGGSLDVLDVHGEKKDGFVVRPGDRLFVEDGQTVELGMPLFEHDDEHYALYARIDGTVHYENLLEGFSYLEHTSTLDGRVERVVSSCPCWKFNPSLRIRPDDNHSPDEVYSLPSHARLKVNDGERVRFGTVLASGPPSITSTRSALSRGVDLLEARKPPRSAVLAFADGKVICLKMLKGKCRIEIVPKHPGRPIVQPIPLAVDQVFEFEEGTTVIAGDRLTDGDINPHDILNILGEKALNEYLAKEFQILFWRCGAVVLDRHLELLCRRLTSWIRIDDPGATLLPRRGFVDRFAYRAENERLMSGEGRPATGCLSFVGMTKALRLMA